LPAITARLLATTLLALLGVPIAMVGAVSRPTPSRFTAIIAAVAVEGMRGAIRALAALQQANSPPRLTV
jgi:hypothetical protein